MTPMRSAVAFALLTVSVAPAADGPATPNPGLRYHYPVPAAANPETIRVDVCVSGGTPGGVGAAVQARRMGKTAVLAVHRRHVGGLTSASLTAVDHGKAESIGGLGKEFLDRVGKWSGFRPSQAERTFRAMLAEAGVPVRYEARLKAVRKAGNRVAAVTFEDGTTVEAKMFIDATYEGDLLAAAVVSYVVGRERNAAHGETVNGFQIARTHQFRFAVDPYRVKGDPASGLLPGITAGPVPATGTGDTRVQAYNFRMWAVPAVAGRPWPKPAGYSRDAYALLLRYLTTEPDFDWDFKYRHGPVKLNAGDCNNAGPISTDCVGASDAWPDADQAARETIFQAHVTYQQGMMWFLANDAEVPAKVRATAQKFGLPKDEFAETDGWPHELYVREARRMVAAVVMSETHCRGKEVVPDPVGLASYTMDSHHTSRVVVGGAVKAEGCIEVGVPRPYPVAYRAVVPKEAECANLLVPVCLSASHVAYGSIRMESVFMLLGQSAATAAALAIDGGVSVQALPYEQLQERLTADKQKSEWQPAAK